MKTVIVGCGRVGAELAEIFERNGYDVVILDLLTKAFDRLPDTFNGSAVRGDGTDEDTLRRAGAGDADVFLAMTEGDNRNVMAAQLASEVLGAKSVIAKINDPLRARAYADLGLATLCRTNLMSDAVLAHVGLPVQGAPGILVPTGTHPGGEHHDVPGAEPIDAGTRPGEMAVSGGGGPPRLAEVPGSSAEPAGAAARPKED